MDLVARKMEIKNDMAFGLNFLAHPQWHMIFNVKIFF